MEKSNKVGDKSTNSVEKTVISLFQVGIEKEKTKAYTSKSDTVSIVSLIDARILITGTVTGNQYVFDGAGTVVAVDTRDKDEILNKKRGRACCGGQSGKNLFQLA